MPKISVVIPVYNGAKTLRLCLDSVLDQSREDFEVVVVDNNSTDSTKAIIEEYRQKDSRVRYAFTNRRKRGTARNAGLDAARGEIIAMTDADCIVPQNWLECLVAPIEDGDEHVVMGYEEDVIQNYWTKHIQEANRIYVERNRYGDYISILDTKNFALSAQVAKEFRFDDNLGNLEDYDFSFIIRDKYKIFYMPKLKVKHYHRNTFWKWFPANFDRGYWAMQVYKKYKDSRPEDMGPMMESISWRNVLSFPFWFVYQFVKRPSRRLWFVFVSEVGWRLGLVRGLL